MRAEEREALRCEWRRSGIYADLTIPQLLRSGAEAHPDDTIVFAASDGTNHIATLASLHVAASEMASSLGTIGVRPGDAVVLQGPSDRAATELLEALWMVGAVVVPVTATSGPADVGAIVADAQARFYVSPSSWRGVEFSSVAVENTAAWRLDHVLTLDDEAPPGATPIRSVEGGRAPIDNETKPADLACILYTSGSTAAPKGVMHSHETLLAGILVSAGTPARSLMSFPAGHMAALLGLVRPLAVGGTTVVMDRWSPSRAVELIEEFGIASSSGTPFFLSTLLDEADRSGRDISSLKTFLTGAASVPPALMERTAGYGIIGWRTYGSTEHPAISSGVPTDPLVKRVTTDGQVGLGNEVRLVDIDGNDVAPGAEGEVVARGPKQFLGYTDPTLDEEAFFGPWFRTGDLGVMDADGYLIITDRLKDIIIRGGENISAREVEDTLASHPGVAEVAVCAAPDRTWGERICAFVRPAAGTPLGLDELADHVKARGLAAHKVPVELHVVDDFPRTAAGKIRKQDLRSRLRPSV